ncbi:MAG: ABC transporter ATP-binding protein [Desulfarculales bacterium]|jgi:branched-chain amino acid transport system ATP-binding protein|nr:ABC transporter ATP-binding protein [Desulfarculales bacterium]
MALLEVRAVRKVFGGIVALRDVDMTVSEGEIHGLIGPNGAGKTTLFNVLSGNYLPASGQILFAGRDLAASRAHERVKYGIARTFQNIRLFKSMSVADNIKTGFHGMTRTGWLTAIFMPVRAFKEERLVTAEAAKLLERLNLTWAADEPAVNLSYGDQRRVEIARALAARPRLLLLDEPAAGLNETEVGVLEHLIRGIRGAGITIVLVEHDMRLLMSVADRVTVLAHGQRIAQGIPEEIRLNTRVINEYLGGVPA